MDKENMPSLPEAKKVTIRAPSKKLQKKVGTGQLPAHVVSRAENVIEGSSADFPGMAKEMLDELSKATEEIKQNPDKAAELRQTLTTPVMNLKANAKMFGYSLVTDLANIVLTFLELVDEIDGDIIQILEAHHNTQSAVFKHNLKGDGGAIGEQLKKELSAACERCKSKKKITQ